MNTNSNDLVVPQKGHGHPVPARKTQSEKTELVRAGMVTAAGSRNLVAPARPSSASPLRPSKNRQ